MKKANVYLARTHRFALSTLLLLTYSLSFSQHVSLEEFIRSSKNMRSRETSFLISTPKEQFTISKSTVELIDDNNYILKGSSDNISSFSLVKSNNTVHGTILKKDSTGGYLISQNQNGELVYTERPFNKMIYTCEMGLNEEQHTHSKPAFSKKSKKRVCREC